METVATAYIAQQQSYKSISRMLPNLKKMGQAKITPDVLRSRLKQLDGLLDFSRKLDVSIQSMAKEDERTKHPYFVDEFFEAIEDAYNEVHDEINAKLVSLTPNLNVSPNEVPNIQNVPVVTSKIKLPAISVPKFDGSYEQWLSFRDQFVTLIIKNSTLRATDRLYHLRSALSGEAYNSISHLDITEENFESAWEILKSYYENKRELVQTHVQNLLNLPTVDENSSVSLRSLRDRVSTTMNILKKLERPVETWDDLLVLIVSKHLDKKSKMVWDEQLGKTTEPPTYSEFDEFLQIRIRTLRLHERQSPERKPEHKQTKATNANRVTSLNVNTKQLICSLCNESHPLRQCPTFMSYNVDTRIEFLRKQNRCYNCLASKHTTKECSSVYRCRKCGHKHHTLLHTVEVANQTDNNPQVTPNQIPTISSNQVSQISPFTSRKVLLATARIKAYSSNGQSIIFRALIDQGSESTLVTENAAQLLKLPRIKQFTRIGGIADTESMATTSTVITIGHADQPEPKITTSAIILKSLTKYNPVIFGTLNWHRHIRNLKFADPDPLSSDPIDIILGADVYGSIILRGLRKGRRNELIAQNTIFGWIISGQLSVVNNSSPINVHCLTMEDLNYNINRFWEIESIPSSLKTSFPTNEQFCDDYFSQMYTRNEEGRCIVRLPFKKHALNSVDDTRNIALANFLRFERKFKLSPQLAKEYQKFMDEYESLRHMKRVVNVTTKNNKQSFILHHAAVVYRVISRQDIPEISFLAGKSKVAPMKTISVPRLELCAAVLLAHLIKFVKNELKIKIDKIYGWSDSTVTLAWLRQAPSRWKTFVANRVAEIQESTEITWSHVPTNDNPADCASRGISPWDLRDRFSSWAKLIRITSLVIDFTDRLRGNRQKNTSTIHIDPQPLNKARTFWIKQSQKDVFGEEIETLRTSQTVSKSSVIVTLLPYLHADGILRARGRLKKSQLADSAKNPILPPAHQLVTLIIRDSHQSLMHGGLRLTLATLRNEYWILKARTMIKSVIHRCVRTTRGRGAKSHKAYKNVKYHLRRTMGTHTLTSEELNTLLCRVEACLNSRPLNELSDDIDDNSYLTPGHFLIGAPLIAPPEVSVLDLNEHRLSRWQLIQRLTETFWNAWQRDYLHTLHQRPKRLLNQQLIKVGQLVLINEPHTPPSHWSMGRITECHPGSDGTTRVVTIKTKHGHMKRPIVKLCLLPVTINETTENHVAMAGGAMPDMR